MLKVCIDAGHGGTDPGALNGARTEKDDNLRLSLMLSEAFKAQGWDVFMPRTDDKSVTLATRTSAANSQKCDLYLSVHRNAGDATANGVEIWVHSSPQQRITAWASDIVTRLSALGFKNRGVKTGYRDSPALDYAVNRDTSMPSMLLEVGFITNAQDNRIYDEKLCDISSCIVRGCCTFMGVDYKIITATPVEPEKTAEKPYILKLETLKAQGYTKLEIIL